MTFVPKIPMQFMKFLPMTINSEN